MSHRSKPRIISKTEVIERIGLNPFRVPDTWASLFSQYANPEARLEAVVKTLELKARILLKKKLPDIRMIEVEERDDDSKEESESSMSSKPYSTDRGSREEDEEPKKSMMQNRPKILCEL